MKKRIYFGIDVGGTFTKACLTDQQGRLIAEGRISSQGFCDKRVFRASVKKIFSELLSSAQIDLKSVKAIGVGLPGPVDTVNGIVLSLTSDASSSRTVYANTSGLISVR